MQISLKRRMVIGLGLFFASMANMTKAAGRNEKILQNGLTESEVDPQLWREIPDASYDRKIPGFLKEMNGREWGLRPDFRHQDCGKAGSINEF
jgi:hypothetical protein